MTNPHIVRVLHAPPPQLLSRKEAAKRLRINVRTLDARIRAGELAAAHIGSRVVIPETAITDMIHRLTADANAEREEKWNRVRRASRIVELRAEQAS